MVSPTELLELRENGWRQRIEVVSLAAEVLDAIRPDHRAQALSALGSVVLRQPDLYHRRRVLRRWPAVHVIATTGVAADHYESGTFWPKLRDLLGISGDQNFQREWGDAFLANLQRLALPTFAAEESDAGSKYVGRILMHSGMPTFCLRDFFRLTNERRGRSPGLQPQQFVAWAAGRAAAKQLYDVDKPVARFLQYGGDFASDVASRSFELLDVVASGGDGADVPLPQRFRDVARDMWANGLLTKASDRAATHVDPGTQPRLVVDPFGRGLMLRLPPVGETPDGRATWTVNLDGKAQTIATRALIPGIDDVAPPTEVMIPGPVRAATIALTGREHLQVDLEVVDDRFPLLAFDEDGLSLDGGVDLPARPTWLLFPGEPSSLGTEGSLRSLAESPLPPGWSGWCLLFVDLQDVAEVRLADFEPARAVRSNSTARIMAGEPVPGVRSISGLPVYANLPEVVLPSELSGANWDVALLDAASNVLARWQSGSDSDLASIWGTLPKDLVGTFTIRVRGPWGRGATRSMVVVSGISIDFEPRWRRFTASGLQLATAHVRAASAVELSRASIAFDSHDRETHLRVGCEGSFMSLVLAPPHMSVAHQTAETSTATSIRPIRLFTEDLQSDAGTLIVDLEASGDPNLHVLGSTGPAQTIEPTSGRAGTYRFELSKLRDTLATLNQCELALDVEGQVVVATVRPRSLFKSVSLIGDQLRFEGAVDLPGMTAVVYPTRAPWRPPAQVSLVEGSATLPTWLCGAGDLRVFVRLEDPWAPAPVPEWPSRGESVLVPQEGHFASDIPEEAQLSSFLSGTAPFPAAISNVDRLWTVRGLLGGLALGDRIGQVAEDVDKALADQPRAALVSIATSRLPLEAIPSLMIGASLPWSDLSSIHEDDPPGWSRRSALPGMLLSAADGEWSADEVAEAVSVCGDVMRSLIAGSDPFASVGRLGPSTDLYDSDPSIRAQLLQPLKLVPKALLDADSRTMAAIEFVDRRRDSRLDWLCKNSRRVVADIDKLVGILGNVHAAEALTARRHLSAESGWRLIPTVSLGYSIAARHAARGNEIACRWIPRQQRAWRDLASVAPSMTTIDLIVAELLTASFYIENGAA